MSAELPQEVMDHDAHDLPVEFANVNYAANIADFDVGFDFDFDFNFETDFDLDFSFYGVIDYDFDVDIDFGLGFVTDFDWSPCAGRSTWPRARRVAPRLILARGSGSVQTRTVGTVCLPKSVGRCTCIVEKTKKT